MLATLVRCNIFRRGNFFEFIKDSSRIALTAHYRVGDGESRLGTASCFLCFFVEDRRPQVIALLSVSSGQNRVAINVIWIELESPFCLANSFINLAVRDGNPRDPAADSWR